MVPKGRDQALPSEATNEVRWGEGTVVISTAICSVTAVCQAPLRILHMHRVLRPSQQPHEAGTGSIPIIKMRTEA